ncbi:CaiB/BaiF CoA-transferase family protein [Paractinoplanes brasiliensis]|uniref:Crotonobetainyl-CoA:carnitine CoA-transferase CaiB-like acyl-CoA transferase n=1 Tax=Paractinoplanes brasiliensis TaxID=52695 RepID=A0A4R6JNP1_9ACTN|nr:CoA transferase [Actinoplanes brasiliensis]TDO37382.1 crotonobetainyl-CoA:carnitine CoA-transferase CaiB-like acyl-CoA transferase [Actinoplanes brasiliensis]GID29302.1 CoA transferase [Actinoplanes brasiliensis]
MKVLDLTDELGAAAIRALIGLGADVVRVPGSGPADRAAALHWYAGTKTAATGDLDALAAEADVIVESGPVAKLRGLTKDGESRWPGLVHVVVTSFGLTGPRRDWLADDLIAASAGGMTWLGGRPDGPPKPPPRESALQVAGAHAAIGACLGLIARDRDGAGQLIDVSAQEAVAATLETGAIAWIHGGAFPRRTGGIYGHVAHRVFRAADGHAAGGYSGSNRMWTDLLAWMAEAGEAEDLTDEKYADAVYRWNSRPHVDEVVARFASRRTARTLGEQGRRRALPWAEVSRADQLAENPQLRSRDFFIDVDGFTDVGYAVKLPASEPGSKTWRTGRTGEPALTGLRVLDLTWVLAGPYATRQLADHGADVIKVESAHRQDPTRFAPSMRLRPGASHDDGGYFLNFNRGKRSIAVNMRTPEGQDVVRRLAARCDVVIDNYSPGTTARWGLDHESLSKVNPGVITVSMSGVGQDGPWRNAVTFADTLAAMSGLTHETADPGGDPQGLTFGLGDMVAANAAVLAIVALLRERRGGFVDLSQLEAMAASMGPAVLEQQLGTVPAGATPAWPHRLAHRCPHGVYPALGEDRWVAVAVLDDEQWRTLARLTGVRETGFDLAERKADEDRIDAELAAWTRTRGAAETAELLQSHGIPAAVVSNGEDLTDLDPQLAARGFYPVLRHPLAGEVKHEGSVLRLSRTPARVDRPAPLLGEHTHAVLTEFGITADPTVLE